MILILSKSYNETTTNKVMDWLENKGANYIRVNASNIENSEEVSVIETDDEFKYIWNINGEVLDLDAVNVVWFRRWLDHSFGNHLEFDDMNTKLVINRHIGAEFSRLGTIFFDLFQDKQWVSSPVNAQNKFEVLRRAKKVGLQIPPSLITNKKSELIAFKEKHGKIITKAISELISLKYKDQFLGAYTAEVSDDIIEELNDTFFFSLFQGCIEKEVELRVFYLNGTCYSMAIFSQKDHQTAVDFRRYNYVKPNRTVPFQLPKEISDKIDLLMKMQRLDNGSIDLILTPENEFVFLEINAVGQFGMVSKPCNYYLEEKMADYLIQKDKVHG
jgi:ATP-GRASP peptide maturase of grasp-with-spasm system